MKTKGLLAGGLSGLPTLAERRSGAVREMRTSMPITGGLIQTLRLIESRHGGDAMLAIRESGDFSGLTEVNGLCELKHNSHWSLLRLNPAKQRGYMELLQTHYPGVQSYYPVYTKVSRPHGARRAREVTRPVYPGYVFLKVGNGESMHGPVSLPVIAHWVRFGGKIEAIPGFVVDRLRRLEVANELVKEVQYVNPYVPGVQVRVHMPMRDIMAVIVKLVGHNRALVDTSLCRVTVPIHTLQIL